MKLIETQCKKCGANLQIDLDNIQAYCQYCGNKLLFDINDLGSLLSEKEKTKQSINDLNKEKEKTKQIKIDNQSERYRIDKEYELKKEKKDSFEFWLFIIFCIALISFLTYAGKHGML